MFGDVCVTTVGYTIARRGLGAPSHGGHGLRHTRGGHQLERTRGLCDGAKWISLENRETAGGCTVSYYGNTLIRFFYLCVYFQGMGGAQMGPAKRGTSKRAFAADRVPRVQGRSVTERFAGAEGHADPLLAVRDGRGGARRAASYSE